MGVEREENHIETKSGYECQLVRELIASYNYIIVMCTLPCMVLLAIAMAILHSHCYIALSIWL